MTHLWLPGLIAMTLEDAEAQEINKLCATGTVVVPHIRILFFLMCKSKINDILLVYLICSCTQCRIL